VLSQNLNRAFVLFELTPANQTRPVDSNKRTLSKCCDDPLRPPGFSESGQAEAKMRILQKVRV
jgi:hypothetical protein